MQEQMILKNEQSQETVCNIVAMWHKSEENYIAYTDGTKDEKGVLELFVSKYRQENGVLTMIPILDEQEWNYIDEYLEQNVFNDIEL